MSNENNKVGFITTKRARNAINERIERLEKSVSEIDNFDVLMSKLKENLEASNRLLNIQDENFKKMLLDNKYEVDLRITSFNDRISNLIDEFNKRIEDLVDNQRMILRENKEYINTKINEFDEQNSNYKSETTKLVNDVNQSISQFKDYLHDAKSDVVKEGTTLYNDEIAKIQKDYQEKSNSMFFEQSNLINNRLLEFSNEFNQTIDKFRTSLKEMIDDTIRLELNNIIIDRVVANSINKILDVFNNSLKGFGVTEKETILDSIKALMIQNVSYVNNLNTLEIKPIGDNELFHKAYGKMKSCVLAGVVPMLVGPAGTGKSTAAEQLSRDLGLHSYMANRIQNTFELVGFVDASGKYVTTQFYEAYTKGGLFLFDEVDASSPEALVTINAAIAQRYMAFPGHPTPINMHKDFKVVCAGNTFGTGSTLQYTGRNKLDAATLDRFMIIEWGYDEELEEKLVADKNLLNFCWKLRESAKKIDSSIIISTRGIITLEKVINQNKISNSFTIDELLKQKFFETTKKDSLIKIINDLKESLSKNGYYRSLCKLVE